MEFLKRYVAAASMLVVALVCALVGLLGLTVFRPPTQQVSSVDSATDLIMTRGNVLSIVKDDVTVTATSKSGAPVTLSIGTTQDVKGWIGDAAYTEVIGVESDRSKLKAESHDAASSPDAHVAQPGAQADVQSGAQPLKDPTSAELVAQLASSDMWFKKASGEGSVSLDLENVPTGRSALAVSAAGAGDLTLTLTWKVEQTNTLAIIAFLTACVFALIALALFLTRWQLLRLRKIRAARIEERRKADSLETASINSAAVAQRVAAHRDSSPVPAEQREDEAPKARDESAQRSQRTPGEGWGAAVFAATPTRSEPTEPAVEDTIVRDVPSGSDRAHTPEAAGLPEDTIVRDVPSGSDRAHTPEAAGLPEDTIVREVPSGSDRAHTPEAAGLPEDTIVREVPQDTVVREVPAGSPSDAAATHDDAATTGAEYTPDPLTDTMERRGRHGLAQGPIDQDPPERATTDTGVIDLSGIRGGRTLPSRRALREARNNGEQVLVVDGQEFNTGLIPVTRPRDAEQAPAPTSAPDDDASATGGWTSIMSGWLKDREEGTR